MRAVALDLRTWAAGLDVAARARSVLDVVSSRRRAGRHGDQASEDGSGERSGPRQRRQRSYLALRVVTVLVGGVVVAAVVFLFVFPTAQWREQRDRIADTRVQVAEAEGEIATLEQRIDDLEDPRTIEYIARERFGFVRPDEAAYRLQPPPLDAATFPDSWPWQGFAYLVNGDD
jgi:cell division protein FtsB